MATSVAFVAVCGAAAAQDAGKAKPKGPPPTPVIVSEVASRTFVDRIEALGTARANETVRMAAKISGRIVGIDFDDGELVRKGAPLVRLNTDEELANLRALQAVEMDRKKAFERAQELKQRQAGTAASLDETRAQLLKAQAEIEAARARLANYEIRAPFDGLVGLRNISIGAFVAPGDLLTTLDDVSIIKIDFSVPSAFLAALKPGLDVEAKTSAYDKRIFKGVVKSVDSRVDPVTRAIVVRATLDNPEFSIRPGMLMQLEVLKNPRDTLAVPENALVPVGTEQAVYVVDRENGNKVVKRVVKLGSRVAGFAEVLSGVAAGEAVITHGALKVRPGQTVTIRAVEDGTKTIEEILKKKAPAKGQS